MTNQFGTSPVGSPSTKRRPTIARGELLKTMFEFFELEPTTAEYEMIDMLVSCFMWSRQGYETVFNAAVAAHNCVHKEAPVWQMKPEK
jgi:hypothetical protein